MKKVALLMSGGVDSSYSAYLLRQKYEVIGIYLKLHDNEEKHRFFIDKCRAVAKNLNIDFRVIDLQDDFKRVVYDYFLHSYKMAQTPNPCAMCNPNIKFGLGLKEAQNLGCDFIASGHYARIKNLNGAHFIQEACDKTKDQSYFLFGVGKEAKDRLIFPLGEVLKEEVKKAAFAAMPWFGELESYKDSQEICFVEKSYIDTIAKDIEVNQNGAVKDKNGNIIGTHKGYMHYTIGKRKGFSVASLTPRYVLEINASDNVVIVGDREDLRKNEITSNIVSLDNFASGDYEIKIRYRSSKIKARVEIRDNRIFAKLIEPVYGVAMGQALVIYKDDCVLGGGFIESAELK